ncbi:MAG: HdeD family acid-resistance protein [Anaerolineales bacterium]|nr:HdeD family acid-resistance protein [Anaerolineales bacterium]
MTAVAPAKEMNSTPWWLILLESIAFLIIGALLLTNPAATTAVLVQVLGIYWIISGVFSLVYMFIDHSKWGWKLFVGILGIIAGVLVLQHPMWSTLLVPTTLVWLLGFAGLFMGISKLIMAFQGAGWGQGILGIVLILLALYLMFNPLAAVIALPLVLGIFGIVGGITGIVFAFRVK